ncbi:glycosyl hydrolase family 28-related protein [Homoserinibacter sp. YIM 151385]|uniref:glycosyl hydrolase family 28-related protein n=1 Tax=Homoserinibacter sp. YIM 151385 TaxID=2985506 RepID=UPI0022F0092D|nr:glycosyl hydrolase family 28-related protein [Homoserinibacter sp. YIM 151385]WBU37504.1 glycosyl hydrolase family 28-related protein [Homoserinibacter sp. YIM 151385]
MPAPASSRTRLAVAAASLAALVAGSLAVASPAAAAAAALEYEAEDAVLTGGAGVNANHLGYSGSGFVDGFVLDHRGEAQVAFRVEVPEAGEYGLNLRYANGLGADMTLSQVAGGEDRQITLPSAVGAGWSRWFVHQEVVELEAGEQEILYRFDDDDTGNVNLDAIALTEVGDLTAPGGGATDPDDVPGAGADTRWDAVSAKLRTTTAPRGGRAYQAEGGLAANGAITGERAVDLRAERARLVLTTFATDARRQLLTIRYRSAQAATLVAGADGLPLGTVTLPRSRGWRDIAIAVSPRQGLGTFELRRRGDALAGELAIDGIRLQRGSAPAARGASLGTRVYEAEHGVTTGRILAPSRAFRELAAEASGRQAVALESTGESISWKLDAPADALALRASIPDTADGAGRTAALGLYAGTRKLADVAVSSTHAWVYGAYPYGNDPADGGAQRFFDESRASFAKVPAGTELRLVKTAASRDVPITVDLIETERRAPARVKPAGYIDIRAHGAVAGDARDDADAIQAAVDEAQEAGTGVWIPAGRFVVSRTIRLSEVAIRGAGPWYSTLAGRDAKGGLYAMGTGVTIADLMIDGDVRYRDDARFDSGIEGNFGQGSLVQDVWVAHTKTGVWVDAGTDGLLVVGARVRDAYADGIHLHGRVADARVEHASVRNTGDDAMAMWSVGGAVTRGVFSRSTVQSPLLGNGAAIYGGDANRIERSIIADTLTAPAGIAVSTRFNPVPFSGTTVVADNDIHRSGGWEPNWSTSFGGIWVFADTSHITTPVVITRTRIIDSAYEGLLVSGSHRVDDLRVSDTRIEGTGSYAVAARVGGEHRFTRVTAAGVTEPADGRNHLWGTFVDGGGNTGLLEAATAGCTVKVAATPVVRGRFTTLVTIRNTGSSALEARSLAWHAGSGEAVRRAVLADVAQNGARVEASLGGPAIRPGKTRVFAIAGTANADRVAAPSGFVLDGVSCR